MELKLLQAARQSGFAISIDAFFALILLVGLIGLIGTGALNAGEQVPSIKVSTLGQNLEDTLTSFENTGFLTSQLNPELTQENTDEIYAELVSLLPDNTEANLTITRYTPKQESVDMAQCRQRYINNDPDVFDYCFNDPPTVFLPAGQPAVPTNTEIIAGRKVVMQKQSGNRIGAENKCVLSEKAGVLKKKKIDISGFEPIAIFEEEEDSTIILNTELKDQTGEDYGSENHLSCYDPNSSAEEQQKQIVDVTITAYSGARDPVSVMFVTDISQSTATFDMILQTSSGTISGGTYTGSCPSGTNLSGTSTADPLTVQTADTFAIGSAPQDHKLGIYAEVTNIQVASGGCPNAGLGFLTPAEPSNKNFYFSYPAGGTNGFCAQRYASGTTTYGTQCTQGNYGDRQSTSNPLTAGNYDLLGWSNTNLSYTVNWKAERLDVAKDTAKYFLDTMAETAKPGDLFGLVSFNGASSKTDQWLTSNLDCIKGKLNNLLPEGGTPISTGIEEATDKIDDSVSACCCNSQNCNNCAKTLNNDNQRFIILLVDGAASSPQSGSEKSWLSYTGTTINCENNCNVPGDEEDCCRALAQAIKAANQARSAGATIFVVGIADYDRFYNMWLTTVKDPQPDIHYVQAMEDLAKDYDRYASVCFDAIGTPIPSAHCGKFYYAEDESALQDVYEQIMLEISKASQTVNIETRVPTGTEVLCNSTCNPTTAGIYCTYSESLNAIDCESRTTCTPTADCDGGSDDSWHEVSKIVYYSQTINAANWSQTFKARIPCDIDEAACQSGSVTFPEDGSQIITQQVPPEIPWAPDTTYTPPKAVCRYCPGCPLVDGYCDPDCQLPQTCDITVPFEYKDLKIVFSDGTVLSDSVSLKLKIGNKGYKPVTFTTEKPLRIAFYDNSVPTPQQFDLINSPSPPLFTGISPGFTAEISSFGGYKEVVITGGTLNPRVGYCTTAPCELEIQGVQISAEGLIFARMDEENIVKQCPKDDDDYISCYEPITYYYVIDYKTWNKT